MVRDDEANARAVNAQPWEPPPGMVKRQCPECRYWFAAPATAERAVRCPDCAGLGFCWTCHDARSTHARDGPTSAAIPCCRSAA